MAETIELPARFAGATHRNAQLGEPVKAVRWIKDGAHPAVERYPIERRAYKGLLVVSPKEKYGLAFGDWIIEDAKGRRWVIGHDKFCAEYVALEEKR